MLLFAGTRLGHYEITAFLGEGGSGLAGAYGRYAD